MSESRFDSVLLAIGVAAGTAGLIFLWQDAQKWHKVYNTAEQLSAVKLKLDAAEELVRQNDVLLRPHHDRVLHARSKHQEMLNYCSQSDEPEDRVNIPDFSEAIKRLEAALVKITSSLEEAETQRNNLREQHTKLLARLSTLYEAPVAAAEDFKTPSISEEMFLPTWLDHLEAQVAIFDNMMAEPEATECEDEADEDQITPLTFALTDLRNRRDQLQGYDLTPDVAAELEYTEAKLAEVKTALSLHGFQIVNDRVVTYSFEEDDSVVPQDEPITNDAVPEPDQEPSQPTTEESVEVDQPVTNERIFDWTGFEAPEARDYGYDEPTEWVTDEEAKARQEKYQRECEEDLQKNRDRILTWQQNNIPDSMTTDNEAEIELELPHGLAILPDIEVGEWCFDEYDLNRSESEIRMDQVRLAAIFRISRQRFREAVQEGLLAEPATALPHDWQTYIDHTFEVDTSDTNSKPWL